MLSSLVYGQENITIVYLTNGEVKEGDGWFGKEGFKVGGYKLEAMYENHGTGGEQYLWYSKIEV